MFKMIDTDNSGQITFEELKAGLERAGANLKESEIAALMEAVSMKYYSFRFSLGIWYLYGTHSHFLEEWSLYHLIETVDLLLVSSEAVTCC